MLRSARKEGLPFSLSRWTDVPGSDNKWAWFKEQLARGSMIAFDPRTAVPWEWSLKPEDTLGFTFWTKDPSNLLHDFQLLQPYKVKVHVTVTGWEEVEIGAPTLREGTNLLYRTAVAFGAENVTWRLSPIPALPKTEIADRLGRIASRVSRAGIDRVFVSFLQENDLMPEARSADERWEVLDALAQRAAVFGIKVLVCNIDQRLFAARTPHYNLSLGICAGPDEWAGMPPTEACGCALQLDPFTINESCTMGCKYCYAADKTLAPKKHNTTKGLPVLR
jgi:hypothetical protein